MGIETVVMMILGVLLLLDGILDARRMDRQGLKVGECRFFGHEVVTMQVMVLKISSSSVKLWYEYSTGGKPVASEEVTVEGVRRESGVQFFPGSDFPFPGVCYEGWVRANPKRPDRVLLEARYVGKGSPLAITGVGWGT